MSFKYRAVKALGSVDARWQVLMSRALSDPWQVKRQKDAGLIFEHSNFWPYREKP
jgi:hypothetical protein